MFDFINSIASVKIEDKIPDLLTLSLERRLINLWVGLSSGSGAFFLPRRSSIPVKSILLLTPRQNEFTICEALNLEGKDTTVQQSHDFKIFNYDPARTFLYMIVYYQGNRSKFQRDYEAYRANCASVITSFE